MPLQHIASRVEIEAIKTDGKLVEREEERCLDVVQNVKGNLD